MVIQRYLTGKGYALLSDEWYAKMSIWLNWYKGYVEDIHKYKVYRPKGPAREADRYRLGMAKVVCEDYASLLINEHVQITCEGFPALDDILERNDFWTRANRLTEITMALGTGAFVEYKGADGDPVIDYIRGDLIYPLSWDGESVTECAFASRKTLNVQGGKRNGYYLQLHLREPKGWRIRNVYLDDAGGEVAPPEGVLPESDLSPVPLFQLVRPNAINYEDLDCPMGMSIFGAAVEQLKACDIVYDSYVNEFVLGKKRLMVPESLAAAMIQESGAVDLSFDPNDALIYIYPMPEGGTDSLKEVDMHIRAAEHEQALQRQIDLISKKCGLGVGRYRFDAGASATKTATEVVSAKSDLFQSLKRHEKTFEAAIVGMARALCWMRGGNPRAKVSVAFDDSIIEDVNATIERNIRLVGSGLRSSVDAIMAIEQCDEATARKKLEAIRAERDLGEAETDALYSAGENMDIIADAATPGDVGKAVEVAQDKAGKTLNGAQTQSLISILTQYAQGIITLGQAIKVISVAIGVTEAEARAILEGSIGGDA